MSAVATGDLQSLMDVLAPDVVLITDGGGVKQAALRPIHGVEKVLRCLAGVLPRATAAPAPSRRSSTAAPACGCSSTTSSTPSPPCGSTTAR